MAVEIGAAISRRAETESLTDGIAAATGPVAILVMREDAARIRGRRIGELHAAIETAARRVHLRCDKSLRGDRAVIAILHWHPRDRIAEVVIAQKERPEHRTHLPGADHQRAFFRHAGIVQARLEQIALHAIARRCEGLVEIRMADGLPRASDGPVVAELHSWIDDGAEAGCSGRSISRRACQRIGRQRLTAESGMKVDAAVGLLRTALCAEQDSGKAEHRCGLHHTASHSSHGSRTWAGEDSRRMESKCLGSRANNSTICGSNCEPAYSRNISMARSWVRPRR